MTASITSTPTAETAKPTPENVDVWSRSGSKYRIRAIVLLAVNVLLFSAVACFAYWIRSGEVFAPAMPGYWGEILLTFNFVGDRSITLANLLVEPINVQDVPMQIVILGLLFAALIAVPILVSILYRFWASIPFIIGVAALAVMPWLAITLLGSCVIASIRPFRTRFRFMSALAGLVPIVVYLIMAWHGSEEMVMGQFDPIERIKFIAPWVLAVVSATLVFAIVLLIAKLVDYRPGAIAPLLAIMFGLPVGLFEYNVGRDELHYRLLESLYAYYFMPWDATLDLEETVSRRWSIHPIPRPSYDELYESEQQRWASDLIADPRAEQTALARHKADLIDRCDWFLRSFPNSRYALNALYQKGRAIDMRVDLVEFRENKMIRFYDDFPSHASEQTWKTIDRNGPHSPTRAVALLNLARLDARNCDMDRAIDRLNHLIERFSNLSYPMPVVSDQNKGVLERARPESSLNINMAKVMLDAFALRDLLKQNADPLYNYEPLCKSVPVDEDIVSGMLSLHPRHEQYRANLKKLRHHYPNCRIADNINLAEAVSTPEFEINARGHRVRVTPSKIEQLEALIRDYPKGDAVPEALYRLASARIETGDIEGSSQALDQLTQQYPESVWAMQAARFDIFKNNISVSSNIQ